LAPHGLRTECRLVRKELFLSSFILPFYFYEAVMELQSHSTIRATRVLGKRKLAERVNPLGVRDV
jgi:hypothetical protein